MKKYFGTDGIRGKVNEKLTPTLALKLGLSAGYALRKKKVDNRCIVIGRDSRNSGIMLEQAISSGFMAQGFDVISLGQIPTPAIAYLTRVYKAVMGVVISASHNPFYDNGIKFFNHEGRKIDDELEYLIEDGLENDIPLLESIEALGRYSFDDESNQKYRDFLKSLYHGNKQFNIVVDTANGAASGIAEDLFKALGMTVYSIGDKPNGININKECGSTSLELLSETVKKYKADFGFAFDGDADRFLAVDENGDSLDGDNLLYLYALYLKNQEALKNNTVVATIMSNFGLKKALQAFDISLVETNVGDRYVNQGMLENDAVLGGEQSGHLIFGDFNTTGDGLLSAIMLLNLLSEQETKTLSMLRKELTLMPQILVNVPVKSKTGWQDNGAIKAVMLEVNNILALKGRLLVRASGTESLIRVMVEGEDEAIISALANKVAGVIKEELN